MKTLAWAALSCIACAILLPGDAYTEEASGNRETHESSVTPLETIRFFTPRFWVISSPPNAVVKGTLIFRKYSIAVDEQSQLVRRDLGSQNIIFISLSATRNSFRLASIPHSFRYID